MCKRTGVPHSASSHSGLHSLLLSHFGTAGVGVGDDAGGTSSRRIPVGLGFPHKAGSQLKRLLQSTWRVRDEEQEISGLLDPQFLMSHIPHGSQEGNKTVGEAHAVNAVDRTTTIRLKFI